jgi:hypothetical protein
MICTGTSTLSCYSSMVGVSSAPLTLPKACTPASAHLFFFALTSLHEPWWVAPRHVEACLAWKPARAPCVEARFHVASPLIYQNAAGSIEEMPDPPSGLQVAFVPYSLSLAFQLRVFVARLMRDRRVIFWLLPTVGNYGLSVCARWCADTEFCASVAGTTRGGWKPLPQCCMMSARRETSGEEGSTRVYPYHSKSV